MTPVEVVRGDGPVILGHPHGGTWLPEDVRARLTPLGQTIADTDWHIARLYDGLLPGATTVAAGFHRYLIDANRDPSGESLYPGQNTTGLVPVTDFDGLDLWQSPPDAAEIAARRAAWHTPYHVAMAAEVARVRAAHGVAILFDCHSIRSVCPFLFDGVLPDLNIGTDDGRTCAGAVESAVVRAAEASEYGHVLNGRFRGGWTTRHYGRPEEGVHAIQLEIAQSAYLTDEAAPWRFDERKAARLRPVLGAMLRDLAALAPRLAG